MYSANSPKSANLFKSPVSALNLEKKDSTCPFCQGVAVSLTDIFIPKLLKYLMQFSAKNSLPLSGWNILAAFPRFKTACLIVFKTSSELYLLLRLKPTTSLVAISWIAAKYKNLCRYLKYVKSLTQISLTYCFSNQFFVFSIGDTPQDLYHTSILYSAVTLWWVHYSPWRLSLCTHKF